eukprot:1024513_1
MSIEIVFFELGLLIQCLWSYSLRSFTLQSPLMPYNGDGWAIHYDSTNHQIWFLKASTPEPMTLHESSNCATSNGDTIYFNDASNLVIGSYNIHTSEWKRPFQTMPHDVFGACLVSDDRFIYVIGGSTISIQIVPYLQIFDLKNNLWLSSPNSLNHNRVWSTCQIHNGTIYIFGGSHETDVRESIEMIFVGSGDDVITNAATQSWILLPEVLASQSMALSSVICTNIDTEILYLLGGWRSSPHDIVEIFDLKTHSLTTLSITLNQARTGHASICVDNYIYAFGGRIGTHEARQTTDSWEKSNMLYYIAPANEPTTAPSLVPTYVPSSLPTGTNSPTSIKPTVSVNLSNVQNYSVTTVDCSDATQNKSDYILLVYAIYGCIGLLMVCFIVIVILFLKLKAMKANMACDEQQGPCVDNEGAQEMARVEQGEQRIDQAVVGNVAIVETAD